MVDLLKNRFVPIAIDNVQNLNLDAGEEKWFKPRFPASTHALYAFRADGTILGRGGGYNAEGAKKMLRKALSAFEKDPGPEVIESLEEAGDGKRCVLPEGGLAAFVTWKVLGNIRKTESSSTTGNGKYDPEFRRSVGADRLWMLKEEAQALANGRIPGSLERRLARFYLSYVFSGRVTHIDLKLEDGRITGTCRTDTGTKADLLGHVEANEGKVTRFDLLAKGWGERVSDCGFSASLLIVPSGTRVPVGILFSLADPETGAGRVPPHKIKAYDYFSPKGFDRRTRP